MPHSVPGDRKKDTKKKDGETKGRRWQERGGAEKGKTSCVRHGEDRLRLLLKGSALNV